MLYKEQVEKFGEENITISEDVQKHLTVKAVSYTHLVNYKQWYCGHYHMDFDDSDSFHFLYQTILKIDM